MSSVASQQMFISFLNSAGQGLPPSSMKSWSGYRNLVINIGSIAEKRICVSPNSLKGGVSLVLLRVNKEKRDVPLAYAKRCNVAWTTQFSICKLLSNKMVCMCGCVCMGGRAGGRVMV